MENRLMANRPSTGRTLPPLVTVPGPSAKSGAQLQTGRSFDKALRNIGQEQTYSRRILDNEKQQIKARYERLKKKASQIRSNLTPEQIAEIKGMERATPNAHSTAEAGNKVELRNHSARLTAQRGQRISLELTTAPTGSAANAYAKPPTASQKRPKSLRAESAIIVPSALAMGQKRVRKSATSAKPDFKSKEDAIPKTTGAQKPGLTKKKSAEDVRKLDTSTMTSWSASRPIPIPQTTTSDVLSKPKEGELKRDRSATFICGPLTGGNSPTKEEPSIAEMLNRPRASSAMGRLQTIPANSSTHLPTVPEEVRKVYSPVTTRKFSTPYPPTRPKSSICAPSSTQISSEHRLAPVNQALRFGRKVSSITPSSARPASRRKSCHALPSPSPVSAPVRSPPGTASVEPPAAFSCHEPKLEDVLSRSYPAKTPAAIRRISTAVSPFQESRVRKLEELREARLDDNESLALELEQRKEKLMKGLQHIGGRPQDEGKEESVQAKPEEVPTSPAKLKMEKHVDCNSNQETVEIEDKGPNTAWREEMMKIRYLRLPNDNEEVITSDMLTLATAQHKAVSKLRKMDSI
ncbi:flocculation protein FLO11-like [Patiria miniata]|uniref:Uncharacterized protein n=1 Tax=Patiria miniata TaxID=46514 RepID=A0A914BLN2_PATMI|nr:flocculation protein FLO11-like [Patiria miniata]XP_038076372.1 flocculation protein FLO11-like [Patiria miniata]XP_038076373.1 flocculation protein FLO11-like [Patiria miniata]